MSSSARELILNANYPVSFRCTRFLPESCADRWTRNRQARRMDFNFRFWKKFLNICAPLRKRAVFASSCIHICWADQRVRKLCTSIIKKQDGVTWNFMKTNTVSGLDQGEPGLYDRLPWCRFGELSFCLNYPLSSEIPPDLLDWFAEVAYSSAKMLQHFTSFYLPRFTRLVSLVSLAVQLQQACHSSCPAKAVDFAWVAVSCLYFTVYHHNFPYVFQL